MFQIKGKEINPSYISSLIETSSINFSRNNLAFFQIHARNQKKGREEKLIGIVGRCQKKKTTMERNDPHLALDRVFEIEVREIKLIGIWDGHDTRVDGTFLHRNASSPSGLERRCLRPNISDSLRKHICLRTNTAKARGEGEAEPSWRCLEAKWNAECVWDCLHCRTIFRVF